MPPIDQSPFSQENCCRHWLSEEPAEVAIAQISSKVASTAWNNYCFQVASTFIRTAERANQQQSEEIQAHQSSQEIRLLQRCARLPAARLGGTQGLELRVPLPCRRRHLLRHT